MVLLLLTKMSRIRSIKAIEGDRIIVTIKYFRIFLILYLDLDEVERDLDLRWERRDRDLEEELPEDDLDLDLSLRLLLRRFLRSWLDREDLELI